MDVIFCHSQSSMFLLKGIVWACLHATDTVMYFWGSFLYFLNFVHSPSLIQIVPFHTIPPPARP